MHGPSVNAPPARVDGAANSPRPERGGHRARAVALSRATRVFVALSIGFGGVPGAGASTPGDSLRIDTLRYGRFGPVVLYRQRQHPSQVVLFVSGDGGWNRGVVGMAEELATMDALVVGIDIRRYTKALAAVKEPCSYPAADFERSASGFSRDSAFPHTLLRCWWDTPQGRPWSMPPWRSRRPAPSGAGSAWASALPSR